MNLTIQELKNWFYIKSTIKKEKRDPNSNWNKFKLRNNWFGRMYTVVSLREEDMGEETVVQNWKAMELMRPINEYLSSLDFSEIIYPSIEKIPSTRSYLVVYSPLFKYVTLKKILFYGFLFLSLIASIVYILKR